MFYSRPKTQRQMQTTMAIQMWVRVLWCILCISFHGSWRSVLCIHHHTQDPHIGTNRQPHSFSLQDPYPWVWLACSWWCCFPWNGSGSHTSYICFWCFPLVLACMEGLYVPWCIYPWWCPFPQGPHCCCHYYFHFLHYGCYPYCYLNVNSTNTAAIILPIVYFNQFI